MFLYCLNLSYILFVVDTAVSLLHWVSHDGNMITRATDIPTDLEALSPIFAGVEILANYDIVRVVFKMFTIKTLTYLHGSKTTTSGCVLQPSKAVGTANLDDSLLHILLIRILDRLQMN